MCQAYVLAPAFWNRNLGTESLKGASESTQKGYRALQKDRTDELHKWENRTKQKGKHTKQHAGSAADSPDDNLPLGLHVLGACSKQRTSLSSTKRFTRRSSQCAYRHHGGHVLDTTWNSQGSALALALCTSQELLFTPRTLWNTSDSHMQPNWASGLGDSWNASWRASWGVVRGGLGPEPRPPVQPRPRAFPPRMAGAVCAAGAVRKTEAGLGPPQMECLPRAAMRAKLGCCWDSSSLCSLAGGWSFWVMPCAKDKQEKVRRVLCCCVAMWQCFAFHDPQRI